MKQNKNLTIPCLFLLLLSMSNTCVQIEDEQAREEQIENAGNNLGQYLQWKKVEKSRQDIDQIYKHILQLQDSLDQIKWNPAKLLGLKIASLEQESNQVNDLKSIGMPAGWEGFAVENPAAFAQQLSVLLYMSDAGTPLPEGLASYQSFKYYRQRLLLSFQQQAGKRKLEAAQIYQDWSRLYHDKALELDRLLQEEDRWVMQDYERLNLQHLSGKYLLLSFEYMEKSDSLLLKGAETTALQKQKAAAMALPLINKQIFEAP